MKIHFSNLAKNKIYTLAHFFLFMNSMSFAMAGEIKLTPGRWELDAGARSWVSTEISSVDGLHLNNLAAICISPDQASDPIDFFAGTFDEWRCSNPPLHLHSGHASFAARCHHRFGVAADGSVDFSGSYTSTRFRLKHLTRFEEDHRQEEIEGRFIAPCQGDEDDYVPYRPYRYDGMPAPLKPQPLADKG